MKYIDAEKLKELIDEKWKADTKMRICDKLEMEKLYGEEY